MVVYTGGACHANQDARFRRAGVRAFWGAGHARNVFKPLAGWVQMNQRAELEAVGCVLLADERPLDINQI